MRLFLRPDLCLTGERGPDTADAAGDAAPAGADSTFGGYDKGGFDDGGFDDDDYFGNEGADVLQQYTATT